MTTKQIPVDFPEIQTAIYRVALSLDSFLVNGIQFGILLSVAAGFALKTASNLLSDLKTLEDEAHLATIASESKIAEILDSLRKTCQQLVELVLSLDSFRSFSPEELRTRVSRISPLRGECVGLIQELEGCFHTPKPFYQSRPIGSTAAVDNFLTSLEELLVQEWSASR